MKPPTLIQMVRQAHAKPEVNLAADAALALFRSWAPNMGNATKVPGMATHSRLAVRIDRGMSVEQAAAREYVYRWHLTLNSMINHIESRSRSRMVPGIWTAPHLLGM